MADYRPRRPAMLGKVAMETFGGGADPAQLAEAAHATANALVDAGRSARDDETRDRLVRLVDDHGLEMVAELWASRPARTLPGALWRLYALREWVRRDPARVSQEFRAGQDVAHVARVVAGSADPPTPDAMLQLADAILGGVFRGDLAVALERAGAFARVLAAGRAHLADDADPAHPELAAELTHGSANLARTAEDLEAAGHLWRHHDLL